VSEGKERRRNMVRAQVGFQKLQVFTLLSSPPPAHLWPQQQRDEMALLDATKSKLIQNALRSRRRYEFHLEESLSTKGSLDYEESLSDFKHMTQHDESGTALPQNPSTGKAFDSTKRLIDQALERNEDSLHEFLFNDQLSQSHLSSMSTLSPRDGDLHFRKIQNRMREVQDSPLRARLTFPPLLVPCRSRRIWRRSISFATGRFAFMPLP
jgi:hypothetical protein